MVEGRTRRRFLTAQSLTLFFSIKRKRKIFAAIRMSEMFCDSGHEFRFAYNNALHHYFIFLTYYSDRVTRKMSLISKRPGVGEKSVELIAYTNAKPDLRAHVILVLVLVHAMFRTIKISSRRLNVSREAITFNVHFV